MRKMVVRLVVNVANNIDAERVKKLATERLCTEDTVVLLAEVKPMYDCVWTYAGSCTFKSYCGSEFVYEVGEPHEVCPQCGGRVVLAWKGIDATPVPTGTLSGELRCAAIPDNVDLRGEAKYRALRALGEGE